MLLQTLFERWSSGEKIPSAGEAFFADSILILTLMMPFLTMKQQN